MGRGNTARTRTTTWANNPTLLNTATRPPQQENHNGSMTKAAAQQLLNEIDSHWTSLPAQVRPFLLRKLDYLGLHELARFWSHSSLIEYTRGGVAGTVCGSSWFIATQYMKLGMLPEASALMINGSFLHECFHTPIETILELCGKNFDKSVVADELPLYSRGLFATNSAQNMNTFLKRGLPEEYQSMMINYSKISSNRDNKMEYIDSISNDWNSSSSSGNSHRTYSDSKTTSGKQIQLILVDNNSSPNDEGHGQQQRHVFDIGSSTTLKTLFNEYAEEKRGGISLRSLRFVYRGNTLFLSSVGNKTPDEMDMHDQDVIIVHDTSSNSSSTSSTRQEPSSSSCSTTTSQTKNAVSTPNRKVKAKNTKPRKTKVKIGKKIQIKQQEPVKTPEECKAQHSKMLTKLHEEVQPRLKEIRNRLNALDLERQAPKKKNKKNRRKKHAKEHVDHQVLPISGTTNGGKAGKPFFLVQVGDIDNLYKTQKPKNHYAATTSIDLHGYTKNEAFDTLHKNLPQWIDVAMKGEYPFVTQVKIICGCGNQILAEVVQEWIRSSRNVSNAPKKSVST